METTYLHFEIYQLQSSMHTVLLRYISIPAGFPSPASDYMEGPIDFNDLMVQTPAATFLVRVQGDSMVDAFIPNKGLLVVDRSLNASSGDIIVAVVNGKFTIKRLLKTYAGVFLSPANTRYKPIKVTEEMNFQVWGVVSKIIIDPKDL